MMTSNRPYLVRAFYEWICENNLTPYIVVDAIRPNVHVPKEYVQDGRIVFNVTTGIVQSLNIANTHIEFDARFSGKLRHVYAPISAVMAIYARENGRGMVFDEEEVFEEQDETGGEGGEDEPPTTPPERPRGKPQLKVVK